MEITLKDGRKATLISENSSFAIIRLADGREMPYPKEKVIYPSPPEPELKKAVTPAIERLEELANDVERMSKARVTIPMTDSFKKLFNELANEAIKDFNNKWGLTS